MTSSKDNSKAKSEKRINVLVQVSREQQSDMPAVTKRLASRGFILQESWEAIGTLLGSIPEGVQGELSKLDGVSAVDVSREDYTTQ